MYFDWGPDLLPTHMINEENCNWAYGFCVRSSQSYKYQTDFRAQNTKRLICLLASRLQHVFSLCTSKIYTLTWNWRTTILPVYRRREKRQCAPKVEVKMKPWCNFRIALLGISMGCYNISSDTHSTFMSLKMLSEVSLSCNKIHLLEHHLIEVWITGFLFVLSCKLGHSIEIHMSFSILTRQKMCKMHFGGDKISWITSFTRKINGINLLFGHLFYGYTLISFCEWSLKTHSNNLWISIESFRLVAAVVKHFLVLFEITNEECIHHRVVCIGVASMICWMYANRICLHVSREREKRWSALRAIWLRSFLWRYLWCFHLRIITSAAFFTRFDSGSPFNRIKYFDNFVALIRFIVSFHLCRWTERRCVVPYNWSQQKTDRLILN